ncbi:MAG TPA: prolipoprotein diacylglyceryl transferase family protein [Pyrinomonadaceae bacterium]|nr:prolipoprotein diacylglyceryl transferase family protein [Pyrinomonadaceae bacterium]
MTEARQVMKYINSFLDSVVRPRAHTFRHTLSGFRVCAYLGLLASASLCVLLIMHLRLSLWIVPVLALCVGVSFAVLAMATKILVGVEKLVFYHQTIFILVICGTVLWLIGQPLASYLDVLALSIGAFHVSARIGCLLASCCHGKPSRYGVSYQAALTRNGFPLYLVGVRLFPIQLVESLWVLGITIVGTVLVLQGSQPGEALAWYILVYAAGRFFFEFMRGDAERPYFWGFSEAQWTSLVLVYAVVLAELAGMFVFHLSHVVGAAIVTATMLGLIAKRKLSDGDTHKLLLPAHIKELALAIAANRETNGSGKVKVRCTSLGLRISTSHIKTSKQDIDLYTLSLTKRELTAATARRLADLLLRLRPAASNELIQGKHGVFHLLLRPYVDGSDGHRKLGLPGAGPV